MTPNPRYNGRTAPQLASDAEVSILGIAHLAEAYDIALDADGIYRTLSALSRALDQVPEAVVRLRAAMQRQHELHRVEITAAPFIGDPDAALSAMNDAVNAMLASFGAARTGLDNAQAAISGTRARP